MPTTAAATTSPAPQLLRRARGRGRRRPAGDRAGHADARRHRPDRRSFLLARAPGCALSVYGAASLGAEAFEAGIAAAAARRRRAACSSRSSCRAAPTRSASSRRTSDSAATAAAPDAGAADRPGHAVRRGHRAALASRRRRARDAARRGQGHASCRRSATTDPNQSHFTSRHFWEVGATDPTAATGWLGPLPRPHGAADNPLQGLSLDGDLSPALATARRAGGGGRAARTTTTSRRPACGAPVEDADARRVRRRSATLADAATRRWRQARGGSRRTDAAARPARAVPATASRAAGVTYPDGDDFADAPARRSPRCSPPACRCAASRSSARRLRHALRTRPRACRPTC